MFESLPITKIVSNSYLLIKKFGPTAKNYYRRPKIDLCFQQKIIEICKNKASIEHVSYPSLIIKTKKDIQIDINSIKINNESYSCIVSRDPNYLNQKNSSKNPVKIENNRIMHFMSNNWLKLTQGSCLFQVHAYEDEVFPIYINKNISHQLFKQPKKNKIFGSKKKLTVSLKIDGNEYQYGIDLIEVSKVIINNLSSQ